MKAVFIVLCFLTADAMQRTSSSFCCLEFPTGRTIAQTVSQIQRFLSEIALVRYFATITQMANTVIHLDFDCN